LNDFFWGRAEEQHQGIVASHTCTAECPAARFTRRRELIKDQNDERTATQRCRYENKCWFQNTLYSSQNLETAYQAIGYAISWQHAIYLLATG
jgi:hypothetical protein